MNYYQSAGVLILGSRFRRLSEDFLLAVNNVYQQLNIGFEAGWFPAFYLLDHYKAISIKQLSEAMGSSHPAASQLVTALKKHGLVASVQHPDDARSQQISLTDKGKHLLKKVKPVWQAIQSVVERQTFSLEMAVLPMLSSLEENLTPKALTQQIINQLKHG
ncbi:MarR family winged helix-turn-helix transcriptional regulator [Mucilaginibacter sp. KACC 22063]|uniref:MarR family winged helix-turn-helix transcriptional regulator n=1 Tax=Mucilaginibacter sp. KACC 22063 TaxID=3025666 RepID=UPI0023667B88|nr:MarR family transcriptional regulator [Mucilaginibacter sp. KACC 22063]WDF56880.1 MarR family transcriptional regulator [Mucilaginibacter sp. KACC 22063]